MCKRWGLWSRLRRWCCCGKASTAPSRIRCSGSGVQGPASTTWQESLWRRSSSPPGTVSADLVVVNNGEQVFHYTGCTPDTLGTLTLDLCYIYIRYITIAMPRFKLVFFSPTKDTARILSALFTQFPNYVGKIGNYEQCAFVSRGTGSRPLRLFSRSKLKPELRTIQACFVRKSDDWIPGTR